MTPRGGSQQELRAWNLRRLAECLEQGPLPQIELAAASGLSEATVSNLVKVLLERGTVVAETGVRNGRRTKVLRLRDRTTAWHLGVDIGRTAIRAAVSTGAGWRVYEADIPVPCPYSRAIETIVDLAARFAADGLDPADLAGAALAVPGLVRTGPGSASGLLGEGYHQAMGWGSVPLARDVSEALRAPVAVENDCNLAALAEMHEGAARGYRDFVYVFADAMSGGGVVLDGALYRGGGGVAGEFGHTNIDPDGAPCWCGARGCLETVTGEAGLVAAATGGRPGGPASVAEVVAAARAGDADCRAAVARAGRAIGGVVGGVAAPLDLGCVVIGGALAGAGPLLVDTVRARLTAFAGGLHPSTPAVVVAELGADGPLRGAAWSARRMAPTA